MGILTYEMKRVISEQKLGFVATVGADGSPNLSPKGLMLALDDEHIIFANIRSPKTIANLAQNPTLEINFVDPFRRKGFRFKGTAYYINGASSEFTALHHLFEPWGILSKRVQGIVKVRVERAMPLISPSYDAGANETELLLNWTHHYDELNRKKPTTSL